MNVKILRQDFPGGAPYWESFELTLTGSATVLDALTAIQKAPVNDRGETVAPVVWECNCMEEVCGACAMMINGKPQMACGAAVDNECKNSGMPLVLAPLSKFPVVRDLVVDRSKIYRTYHRLRIRAVPKQRREPTSAARRSEARWDEAYPFTQCMSCGICTEACPNAHLDSLFTGAAGMSIYRALKEAGCEPDLTGMTEKGGVSGCSGYSLCAKACPKQIDLMGAIARVNRDVNKKYIFRNGFR